jgi:hypothetical protein
VAGGYLLLRLLEDVFLHGVLAHQAVDVHLAGLADAVGAVLLEGSVGRYLGSDKLQQLNYGSRIMVVE